MFSKSTEYALRALIYLAQNSSEDHKIGITELARAIDSPKSFTAKILQKLTQGDKLINSVSGPTGGFYLSEQAKKKSMLKVLTILDTDHMISGCILGLSECSELNPCPMHEDYAGIRAQLVNMFGQKSLEALAMEMNDPKAVIHNIKKKKAKR
jgi:Rrf2 family iron-sulfur cluster assembly transcriptional regulator